MMLTKNVVVMLMEKKREGMIKWGVLTNARHFGCIGKSCSVVVEVRKSCLRLLKWEGVS
jgi:hypothetical protein